MLGSNRASLVICCLLSALPVMTCFPARAPAGECTQESPVEVEQKREQANRLQREGNFAEAYVIFRELCLDSANSSAETGSDLQNAIRCLQSLSRISEFDELIEATITAHAENWRLLRDAAQSYLSARHDGFMISGKFERGPHRGGGRAMHCWQRDQVRALQLLFQAMPFADDDSRKREVSRFYVAVSDALLMNRSWSEAWRLQSLSDLSQLPDYEEGYYYGWHGNGNQGAAVDVEGNPVFHDMPESWDAATSDGERWRWALSMALENDPDQRNAIRMRIADFSRAQFGVPTMMQGGWNYPRRNRGEDDEDESGTYALHTLEDAETIARLANGIKRFPLPDDYNFIHIYRDIADQPLSGYAETALYKLAQLHEDRRQYPQAAEIWRESIREYGDDRNKSKQKRLDQIVASWGRFEGTEVSPAGEPAKISFRFRNGNQVELTAHRVDLEKLLRDVKAYIRSEPRNLNWQSINLQNLGYRLVNEGGAEYLEEEEITWTQELEPRENHFDRRAEIETPFSDPGVYYLTAKMKDGNSTSIVVWLADTALVRTQLDGRSEYYVADAKTGAPIERANVEFFGYQQRYVGDRNRGTNRLEYETVNFSERSDANGLVHPDADDEKPNMNWLIIARGEGEEAGRLAFIGFVGIWHQPYYDQEYNQTKTFFMTDRPVYRPEQTVHIKAWVRHAQYDRDRESQFANTTVEIGMNSPNGEELFSKAVQTDAYGGFTIDYELPADAKLGAYLLWTRSGGVAGGNTFRVEEYKKPEYEVTIDAPSKPVALGETITATIDANYYFGAPVTDATVKYTVTRTNYEQRWYPVRYWDWCYSPGYWWYCYDYPWYDGFDEWVGCRAPFPWWWNGPTSQPEIVAQQEVPIGPDGKVEVSIDTSVAKELHGDVDHQYKIVAEVRDQSRRTIVGEGSVLVARQPFKVFTWVDRGYYRVGQTIRASFKAQTLDQNPVVGSGTLTLLRITYDADQNPIETPVREWQVDTDQEGLAKQQMSATASGQYRLSYRLRDEADHEIEGGYLFTIIGDGFDGREYRFSQLELIPDKDEYAPGEKVRVQVNTEQENSTVLLYVRPSNGICLPPEILFVDGKSTVVEIDVVKKDMPNFYLEAMTISDGKLHTQVREIIVPPEDRVVNVNVTPSATEYRPGEKATIDLQLTDLTGENYQGTTVVSVYDKSVEYISNGSNIPEIREFFWKWRRQHQPSHADSLKVYLGMNVVSSDLIMNNLGVFGGTVVDEFDSLVKTAEEVSGNRALRSEGMALRGAANGGFGAGGLGGGAAAMADAEVMMQASEASVSGDRPGGPTSGAESPGLAEPTVRSNFADTALWVGVLETDATGHAQVELDMPENLTTWKVNVWAMGHGTRVGSGSVEVITRKDLLVRMQAPRFFVERDIVYLTANVHNYLEEEKQVTVRLELDGEELVSTDELTRHVTIPADGEARVDWRVQVAQEGTAKIRMFALTDVESDAMEMEFPVYVHGMMKQEAWAGTIRPSDEIGQVVLNIPEERRADQSRIEVRYSPTLAGSMVDSLPYLTSYPYGCTEQTLNRWLPTLITQQTLIEMGLDLEEIKNKRTNLNAQELGEAGERAAQWQRYATNSPVFDRGEVDKMVREGLKRLAEMQVSDGGFGWFSGYGEYSSPHTTATVVRGLLIAKQNDVPIVPGMLERAISWLQAYQQSELQKLKNAEEDVLPKKLHADNLDALVYAILVDVDQDNLEMREFLYRDRNHLTVYGKGLFGLALHEVGDDEKLAMIIRNINQFLVQDEENETAYLNLPETYNWWYWYGDEIESQAVYLKLLSRTDPDGIVAPRLVKYLLNNRKHATYWKSTRDTALCVEAFAEFIEATGESRPEMVVEIWWDGEKRKEVEITSENLFSFDNQFVIEGEQVTSGEHRLEIRRRGTGAVYFNAYSSNFTLEDFITKAGLEVKVERKYYKLIPVDAEQEVAGSRGQVVRQQVEKFERIELSNLATIESGDLVEVELSIESKNDYEYLLFEDMKPAGFEPVDLRSGYNGNELNAYAEFRDNRVSFFVRRLARGDHSVSYRMRAETPGRFSALPARVEAMYAPELRGNSDEIKLEVSLEQPQE